MISPKKPVIRVIDEQLFDDDEKSLVSSADPILVRPDGYYWLTPACKQEFGPFETLELARADMACGDDPQEPAEGGTLQEAENEIGISDWIDPETGEPAEGLSRPRLEG